MVTCDVVNAMANTINVVRGGKDHRAMRKHGPSKLLKPSEGTSALNGSNSTDSQSSATVPQPSSSMTSSHSSRSVLEIVWTFIKLGFMTFGGGYAMIPLIEEEMVAKKRWLDKERMVEAFAVSQSLPGSIAINTSVLIGYEIRGVGGALAAVTGAAIPPFVTLTVISAFFSQFKGSPIVDAAFAGVRCAVVALILHAGLGTAKSSVKDGISAAILVITIALMLFTDLNPAVLILVVALMGVGAMLLKARKERPADGPCSSQRDEVR